MTVRGLLYRRRKGSGSFDPSRPLEGSAPHLWLRADQGVHTGGARQFHTPDLGLLKLNNNASVSTGDVDFTIAGWVRADAIPGTIISKLSSGLAGEWDIKIISDTVQFRIWNGGSVVGVIAVSGVVVDTWYFFVAWHDSVANTLNIQLNNGVVVSSATTGAPTATSESLQIGGFADFNTVLYGRTSLLGFWKRTLTTAEKTYLYNSDNGRVAGELGIVGTDGAALADIAGGSLPSYWNQNETSGTADAIDAIGTNDLIPTFAELSTNGVFSSDTGWTKGTGWTIAAGVAASSGVQVADSDLEQALSVRTGGRYTITFTVSAYAAGNVCAVVGGTEGTDRAANGTYAQTITVASTNSKIAIRADADFIGAIDSVSVVAVDIPAADGPADSTVLVTGDAVNHWYSLEGNNYDFAQATASKRPSFDSSAINGKPGIAFDGLADLLVKASAFLTGTAGTIIVVFRLDSVPNSYQTLLASSDEAGALKSMVLYGRGNDANGHVNISLSGSPTAYLLDGNTVIANNTDYVVVCASDGATTTVRLNGTAQTLNADAGSNSGDWFGDVPDKDNVAIGARKNDSESNLLSGKLCEVYVHPLNVSAASIAKIDAYIFGRYGLHV